MIKDLEPGDLPLLTHTYALGVDIKVRQQAIHREAKCGESRYSRDSQVEVETWQGNRIKSVKHRRNFAIWARRNLFDGAEPGEP